MPKMTRIEIEQALEKKYRNKIVTFINVRSKEVTGKIHSITCWIQEGEPMVILNLDKERYEVDLNYFLENTDLHGNTPGTDTGDSGVR